MKNVIVPLFCTPKLDATKAFYQQHLGFRIAVEMPGYAELEQGEGGPPPRPSWSPDGGEAGNPRRARA